MREILGLLHIFGWEKTFCHENFIKKIILLTRLAAGFKLILFAKLFHRIRESRVIITNGFCSIQ